MANIEWDTTEVFPICCAADLTPERLEHFLNEARDGGEELRLVLVDNMTNSYAHPPKRPITEPSSSASPFKGLSARECYSLLERLDYDKDNSPEINCDYFGILDERSTADDTLLLVFPEKGEVHTVRCVFRMAGIVLASRSIGDGTYQDLLDAADRCEGGVYGAPRRQSSTPDQDHSRE